MDSVEAFDQGFWNFLQAKRGPRFDMVLLVIRFLALPQVVGAVAVAAALFFLYRRRLAEAGLMLGSCGGSFLLAVVLGWLIERPPPSVKVRPLEESLTTSSFPSRETMVAAATYTALALALQPRLGGRWRVAALLAALGLAGLIALCRAFVGTNYPSDVLAGLLGGLAWTMICYTVAERWLQPVPTPSAASG